MPKIKAVLFDMDGVLIDACEWHYEALNRALAVFGHVITREEHEDRYNGIPTRKKLELLTDEKSFPRSLHDVIYTLKQRHTMDIVQNEVRPSFHKKEMVKILKKKNLKLAVCSNSIRDTVHTVVNNMGLYEYFDLLVSNQDITKSKPDPEMYLYAMNKFGVRPTETLIVEDSPRGIEAAQASGAQVIIVNNATEVHTHLFKAYIPDII